MKATRTEPTFRFVPPFGKGDVKRTPVAHAHLGLKDCSFVSPHLESEVCDLHTHGDVQGFQPWIGVDEGDRHFIIDSFQKAQIQAAELSRGRGRLGVPGLEGRPRNAEGPHQIT